MMPHTEKARTIELLGRLMAAVNRGALPTPQDLVTTGEAVCSRTPFNRREVLIERQAVQRVTRSVLAIQALEPGARTHEYLPMEDIRRWRDLIRAPRAWILPPAGTQVEVVLVDEEGRYVHHEGVVVKRMENRIEVSSSTGGDWYVPRKSPVPCRKGGSIGYSWRPL